jgi:hypothetical protein
MVQSKCGDDNAQCRNGQNIIQVYPCLKLFKGCPIMVSTNINQNLGAVKGTMAKFMGVKLKKDKSMKMEVWNWYKVYIVEANDIEFILCEHTKLPKMSLLQHLSFPQKISM